jgi:hypothetical protein
MQLGDSDNEIEHNTETTNRKIDLLLQVMCRAEQRRATVERFAANHITVVGWLVTFVGVVAVRATVAPASTVVTTTSVTRSAARCRGRRAHDASETTPEMRFRRFSRSRLDTEGVCTGSHNRADHVVLAGGQEVDTVLCHHVFECVSPTVNV